MDHWCGNDVQCYGVSSSILSWMCVSSYVSAQSEPWICSSSIHSSHLSSENRPRSDPSWISMGTRQIRGNPGITVAALALARMLARSITESSRTGSKHSLSHTHTHLERVWRRIRGTTAPGTQPSSRINACLAHGWWTGWVLLFTASVSGLGLCVLTSDAQRHEHEPEPLPHAWALQHHNHSSHRTHKKKNHNYDINADMRWKVEFRTTEVIILTFNAIISNFFPHNLHYHNHNYDLVAYIEFRLSQD